jgi:hypothetical protein
MPAETEQRRQPDHEDVVATLLGMQAKLRGEASRKQLPHFVEVPEAMPEAVPDAATTATESAVVQIPEAAPERTDVIRLHDASEAADEVQRRLDSIIERLDLLEEGLTTIMIGIEERAKA